MTQLPLPLPNGPEPISNQQEFEFGYPWVRDEEGRDPNDTHLNGLCVE